MSLRESGVLRGVARGVQGRQFRNLPPADISYLTNYTSETNAASYTASSVSLGADDASRYIFAACLAPANSNFGAITGLTIGGNAMTQHLLIEDASGFSNIGLYGLLFPTGATANIVASLSGSPDRFGMHFFRATKMLSAIARDTLTVNTGSVNLSGAIDYLPGGFILSVAGCENSNPSWTWTNATLNTTTQAGTGGGTISTAFDKYTSAGTVTITAAPSAAQSRQGLISAAFR